MESNYEPAMWEIIIEKGTEYADPIVCKTKDEAEEMQRRTDYSTGIRPLFYKTTPAEQSPSRFASALEELKTATFLPEWTLKYAKEIADSLRVADAIASGACVVVEKEKMKQVHDAVARAQELRVSLTLALVKDTAKLPDIIESCLCADQIEFEKAQEITGGILSAPLFDFESPSHLDGSGSA